MTSVVEVEVLSSQAGRSSAYLLHYGATRVLVDCGPGTAVALDRRGLLGGLDAVVVTHQHADHAADVIGLAYARCFPEPAPKVPLYAPAATLDTLSQLDDLFAVPTLPAMGNTIATSFDLHALPMDGTTVSLAATDSADHRAATAPPPADAAATTPAGADIGIGTGTGDTPRRAAPAPGPSHCGGGLLLSSFTASHAVPSAALRFTAYSGDDADDAGATGLVVAFSSDTSRCDGVVAAARGSDLFLCEATYLTASPAELEGHGHLTPEQAAQLAVDADVRHLALVHLAHPAQHAAAAAAAAAVFEPDRTTVVSDARHLTVPSLIS